MAASTYCRECSAHFNIENGVAVSTQKKAFDPFANRPAQSQKTAPPEGSNKKGPSEKSPVRSPKSTLETPSESSPKKDALPAPSTPEKSKAEEKPARPSYLKSLSAIGSKPEVEAKKSSFFSKKEREPRLIRCFECHAEHSNSPNSTSALCPKCGTYISLKDYEINGRWNRRIQTRGDVFIQKKGVVSGTTIQCHHLILEGDFTGGVECSGDLIIRRNGKIMGKVICRKLIVKKRANVEFLNSVETDDCVLDGLISGNIHCKGLLSLQKKAILTGNVKVGRIAIAEGAQHHGEIQMGG